VIFLAGSGFIQDASGKQGASLFILSVFVIADHAPSSLDRAHNHLDLILVE
jgi:hypothetical protein